MRGLLFACNRIRLEAPCKPSSDTALFNDAFSSNKECPKGAIVVTQKLSVTFNFTKFVTCEIPTSPKEVHARNAQTVGQ